MCIRDSHKILLLSLPASPPELVQEPGERRTIKLWVGDRKSVWLHQDDVEWAVKYLFIQITLKGVPLVPSDSQGPIEMQAAVSHVFAGADTPSTSSGQDSPSRGSGEATPVWNGEEIDFGTLFPAEPVSEPSAVSNGEQIDLGIASPCEPVRRKRARSEDFAETSEESESQDPSGADSQLPLF